MSWRVQTDMFVYARIHINGVVSFHYISSSSRLSHCVLFDVIFFASVDTNNVFQLGHAIMIANAKDEFNKKVTSGGKPVMDYLGASLVRTLQESVPHRSLSELEVHER